MIKTVQATISQYKMMASGASVLVALSGGADSVALLLCLRELGYTVSAAHLHHGLRGAEADRDADFVRDICQKLRIPCQIEQVDVATYAKTHGLSIETAARQVRYAFLGRALAQTDATAIATAHTASDNLETVLHHLMRGTGTRGLAGIPPVRGNIVRPLLAVTREQVEGYLQLQAQDYITDSTNADATFTRNRIRQTVVPQLCELAPSVHQATTRMCELVRRDCDCLDVLAEQEAALLCHREAMRMTVRQTALRQQHPAVASRVLGYLLAQMGVPTHATTATHYAALLKLVDKNGSCDLPGGFAAWSEGGVLAVEERPNLESLPIVLDQTLPLWHSGCSLTVKRIKFGADFNKSFNTFAVDCDTIDFSTLHVRPPQAQDRIWLPEARGERQLKRLLDEYRVPRAMRATLAVLADAQGIVAVQAVGIHQTRQPQQPNCLEIAFQG